MEIGNLEAFLGIFTLSSYIQHGMMVNSFMQFLVYRTVSLAFLYVFCTAFIALPSELFASPSTEDSDACRCVVFRFDDIQDYSKRDNGQIAPLEVFREKNASVTLGIIAGFFGKDLEIVNYTKIGVGEGLFEPSIHGWSHVSYPDLSLEEQTSSISNASSVLDRIYHTKPNVFIPPYNEFNNDTLRVLSQLGIEIFCSEVERELDFNGGKSIFIAKNVTNVEAPPTTSSVSNSSEDTSSRVYHLPTAIEFERYGNDSWIKVPVNKILEETSQSIEDYGYGVINLHPTNFLVGNDTLSNRTIDVNDFNDLSLIVNTLSQRGIPILSMSDIVEKYG